MLDLVDEVFPVTLGDALRAPGRSRARLDPAGRIVNVALSERHLVRRLCPLRPDRGPVVRGGGTADRIARCGPGRAPGPSGRTPRCGSHAVPIAVCLTEDFHDIGRQSPLTFR